VSATSNNLPKTYVVGGSNTVDGSDEVLVHLAREMLCLLGNGNEETDQRLSILSNSAMISY
jgi:hypothetical protein